ncbi:MAG: methylmalonyl Co-A mutase-associated GTPase MeaB [Candidatus Eisenbacteria bacterium]|nr:methylmalonyl Co-A mutase-associated GTPase MeaB [Candidatus Eisenbacteria bacterium]
MPLDVQTLLKRFREGDRVALSRVISLVENDHPSSPVILDTLYPFTGKALRVGVTGPPGAGKSTLVDHVAARMRTDSQKVGIVAVDPTSPFSGGALLGDRVRMSSVNLDDGVFIRSMASRGSSGGLAWKTFEVCEVLDAFGVDRIIVETVGVGQGELEIADEAHSTVVVLVPESGDGVQAMKAGLMEIGDIFVINKSDRESADTARRMLDSALELKPVKNGWRPPVLSTVALKGEGVEELHRKIEEHLRLLVTSGSIQHRRMEGVRAKIVEILRNRIIQSAWERNKLGRLIDAEVVSVMAGGSTPYKSAAEILRKTGQ